MTISDMNPQVSQRQLGGKLKKLVKNSVFYSKMLPKTLISRPVNFFPLFLTTETKLSTEMLFQNLSIKCLKDVTIYKFAYNFLIIFLCIISWCVSLFGKRNISQRAFPTPQLNHKLSLWKINGSCGSGLLIFVSRAELWCKNNLFPRSAYHTREVRIDDVIGLHVHI